METTADDYDKFLRAYLNYEHLPADVQDILREWDQDNSGTVLPGVRNHGAKRPYIILLNGIPKAIILSEIDSKLTTGLFEPFNPLHASARLSP